MRPCFALAILVAGAALACRDPTQVTLELSTNATCPAEPLAPLMLLETGIVAGPPERVSRPDAAANTTTSACNAGEIGTVVLYPEDGALDAGALVIGRLYEDGDAGSVERCIQFANPDPSRDPSLPPIDGSNCIVARRRVAFIEHVPLRLPIRLDVACAGVLCPSDQTCVADPGGVRCVSAEVGCDEKGSCEEPGAGGGGVGGSGGGGGNGGDGGSGGRGGEGGSGPFLTEIGGLNTFDHVAGVAATGTVYVLDIGTIGSTLYRVDGNAPTEIHVESSPMPMTSRSMRADRFGNKDFVAWDHDGTVKIFDGSQITPSSTAALADFVLEGPQQFSYLSANDYVVSTVLGGSEAIACQPPGSGTPLALARGGGGFYVSGSSLCDCLGCVTPMGHPPFTDISALPSDDVAVAVSVGDVYSMTTNLMLQPRQLLASLDEGELGKVHVTPSGAVWVAAIAPSSTGATYVGRGAVTDTGALSATFASAAFPGLGGVKSLWATDVPAPAAYVVTTDRRLFRIEGL